MALPPVPSNENHIPDLIRIAEAPKPQGEFRILVTGGSTAYGLGTSAIELAFPPQLQLELRRRFPDKNIRVLNGGVSSFDSSSELLLYLRFSRKIRPDLVIMFSGFNDLYAAAASQLSPRPHREVEDLQAIKFVRSNDLWGAAAFLARAVLKSTNDVLIRVSRIFQLLEKAVLNLAALPIKPTSHFQNKKADEYMGEFADGVRAFHAVCDARGISFLLAIQPIQSCGTTTEGIPSSWAARMIRAIYLRKLGPIARKLGSLEGIPVVDLNGPFVDHLNSLGAFWDVCHLSDAGYRESAIRVADHIQARNLLK